MAAAHSTIQVCSTSFYPSIQAPLMLFGGCVAECRLGSRHGAPFFSNHTLNYSFSACLRNLNKKSSIHIKKNKKNICWCMNTLKLRRKGLHSTQAWSRSTLKMPSKSQAVKLTSAESLSLLSSQMDRSQQELESVCVGWIKCSIIQWFQPVFIHAWQGDSSHLSVIALTGTCRLSLQGLLLLFDPLLSEKILRQLLCSHIWWHLFQKAFAWMWLP